MSISSLRQAVTNAGSSPVAFAQRDLWRELITAWGGTPTQFNTVGLLREAIVTLGGTPTQFGIVPLLRELVTALGGSPETYEPDALEAQVAALALSDPSADYAFYADFKNGVYRDAGGKRAALSDLSGYSFTDSVDNQPNLSASGFNSLTAQSSNLSTTCNPHTTDADFIAWVVATFPGSSGGFELLLNLGGTAGNRISLYRDGSNGLVINAVGTGTSGTGAGAVATAVSGRVAILYRRKAGKDTYACKVGSTVTLAGESGDTSFANPTSALKIGVYVDGTLQPNAFIEGAYIKTGWFTDGDLNTILAAA